ncbi:hypothetical protein T484DRAFT_1838455 [Baffinella frigidus]|nr:hypothetical protein T484DRAFT_1838455 [Cryptophyta sp. CCMP2293]
MLMNQYMKPTSKYQARSFRFSCTKFTESVDRRYELSSAGSRVALHTRLASYFRARADPELQFSWRSQDFRAANCLAYHMIGSKRWGMVSDILTDLGFLEMCVRIGRVYGLCDDISNAVSGIEGAESDEELKKERIKVMPTPQP